MVHGGVGPFSPTTYVQLSKGHCLRSIMVNHRETDQTIVYLFQASFTSISKTISWDENSTPRIPCTLVENEGRFSERDFPNLPKKCIIHYPARWAPTTLPETNSKSSWKKSRVPKRKPEFCSNHQF